MITFQNKLILYLKILTQEVERMRELNLPLEDLKDKF